MKRRRKFLVPLYGLKPVVTVDRVFDHLDKSSPKKAIVGHQIRSLHQRLFDKCLSSPLTLKLTFVQAADNSPPPAPPSLS